MQEQRETEVALAGDNAKAKIELEEVFDKRQRDIRRKQAQADKDAALFSIALNTSQALLRVFGTSTYADFGISAGILAALVLAQGAAQAAVVASRPLPAYRKGVRDNPAAGPAVVGEAGRELVRQPGPGGADMWWLTPNQATVTHLAKGTDVFTSAQMERMLAGTDAATLAELTGRGLRASAVKLREARTGELTRAFAGLLESGERSADKVARAIERNRTQVTVNSGSATVKQAEQWTTYLASRVSR